MSSTPTPQPAAAPGTTAHQAHAKAILAVACIAQFMVVLDVSIVNVALPAIRNSLDMTTNGLQWVVNAYTITFAGFLLLGGRLADLFGRRTVFLAGVILFTLASFIGGLAPNGPLLIVARAIQGLGGAVLAPATLTLLATTFTDPRERARAFGTWGAVAGAGGAFGALIGGVLTDALSWRFILFVNVPIGIALVAATLYAVAELKHNAQAKSLDILGAVSVTAGIMAVVYGIVHGESDGWSNVTTMISLIGGVALVALFLLDQAKIASDPLMPLRIFRSRSLSAANVLLFFVGASMFAMFFFLSLYMQQVRDYSPTKTGVAFLPLALGIMFGARTASKLVHNLGPRALLVPAMLVATGGLAWFAQLDVDTNYWLGLVPPMILMGIAMGTNMASVTIAGTSGVKPQEAGLASGLLNTSRQLGGALGLAILSTVATARIDDITGDAAPTPQLMAHALTEGYTRAFAIAAVFMALAAIMAVASPGKAVVKQKAQPTDDAVVPEMLEG